MTDLRAPLPEAQPSPSDQDDGWQRTSPLSLVSRALHGLQQAILPMAAIIFGSQSADLGIGLTIAVLIAVLLVNFAATALSWWRTQYRIGSDDVRVHTGIFGRQARSVPFERIQDVSLEQGLVARMLGLVEVRFETGAGGKDELKLAYVSQQAGEALRETVRLRIDPAAHPEDSASPAGKQGIVVKPLSSDEGSPLFVMTPKRLLVFGIFEFSLIVFAVLAGAAQQFDFLLPFDLWDFDDWEDRLTGPGAWLAGLGTTARIVGALIAILALGLVGLTTGIARTFAREFAFRLDHTARGLRRRRGLFTRSDVIMPVHRVQAVTVDTGPIRRWWGWHGLSLISLASDAKSANHSVAPFARLAEIDPIAKAAGFVVPGDTTQWHRSSARYRIDRAILSALPPALATLITAALGFTPLAAGLAFLAVFSAARHYLLWRHERHALDIDQVMTRKGWLSPILKLAARRKLHSASIIQGPLARRRGYAEMRFGLAGGTLRIGGVPLAEACRLRAAIIESIAAVDFSDLPR